MTALWIILGIIAFIAVAIYILLHISICAYVDASNKGVKISVTYLGFKLWSFDSNNPKQDEKTSQENLEDAEEGLEPVIELSELTEISDNPVNESNISESIDEADEEPIEEKENSKLDDIKSKIEEYKPLFPVAKKGFRKLIKLIRFYDLELNLTVGDNDAYKAAMTFGEVNALVYSLIGLLCTAFSVKIKHTNINCVFDEKKLDASFKTVVKARPSAVACLLIYLGVNYLKFTHNNKKKSSVKELNNERTEEKS